VRTYSVAASALVRCIWWRCFELDHSRGISIVNQIDPPLATISPLRLKLRRLLENPICVSQKSIATPHTRAVGYLSPTTSSG
jgi:hypothetical protein